MSFIEIEKMKEGDVIFGENNKKGHPIVFLSDINDDIFHGAMLTHSTMKKNVLLLEEHFDYYLESFKIKDTHVVRRSLIKNKEWAPFNKVARLSKEGISFIQSLIANQEPKYW